jgi:hypothetical protein
MNKNFFTATFIWTIILSSLYLIDCYFLNFLNILYAIIANFVFFGLYLLTILVLNELNKKQENE